MVATQGRETFDSSIGNLEAEMLISFVMMREKVRRAAKVKFRSNVPRLYTNATILNRYEKARNEAMKVVSEALDPRSMRSIF